MELKKLFRILLKWLWIFLLIPSIALGITAYISVYKSIPVYESTSSLFITRNSSSIQITDIYGQISTGQAAVKNYSDIIKSKAVLNEVVESLGLKGVTPGMLVNNISVVLGDRYSFVLFIKVRHVDPVLSRDITNSLCDIFVKRVENLMDMRVVEVLDRAETPAAPISDSSKKNMVIAAFAGFIMAGAIVFMIEYLNTSIIKNEEDVKKYLDLPVLGIIPVSKE